MIIQSLSVFSLPPSSLSPSPSSLSIEIHPLIRQRYKPKVPLDDRSVVSTFSYSPPTPSPHFPSLPPSLPTLLLLSRKAAPRLSPEYEGCPSRR